MVQANLETVKHQTTTTPTVGQHKNNLVMQGLMLNEKQNSLNKRRQQHAALPQQQQTMKQVNSQNSVESIIPSRNDVSILLSPGTLCTLSHHSHK
jgi:hypothetical protein